MISIRIPLALVSAIQIAFVPGAWAGKSVLAPSDQARAQNSFPTQPRITTKPVAIPKAMDEEADGDCSRRPFGDYGIAPTPVPPYVGL